MTTQLVRLALVSSAVISTSVFAGPPLVTDDTGVLEPGAWEFLLSAEIDEREEADVYVLPGFEANYGLTETTAVTVALGRLEVDPEGEESKSDLSAMTLEYKWLFYQGENTALAVVPAYSFPVNDSSKDRGVIDDLRVLSLPIVGSYATGDWEFTAQYTYELTSESTDAAFYGLSSAYSLNESVALLAEVYHITALGPEESETNFTLGIDYSFGNGWAALFSYGGSIDSDLPAAAELDKALFFGIRYETG